MLRWGVGNCRWLADLDNKVNDGLFVNAHVVKCACITEALPVEYEHLVVEQDARLRFNVPLQVGDEHGAAAAELHQAIGRLGILGLCALLLRAAVRGLRLLFVLLA